MGDKTEQPGPSEARLKFTPEPDGTDVEGHKRVAVKLTDDEPGPSEARKSFTETDEDDVEGHITHKSL